ncbi:MAG TPA: extracellular solute-binding protein [Candidatus Hydrogenedentes bacterium]|nr:extracellular solute-binding protein [Candidatus Hydrogenedentota bacterium]
MQLDVSRAAALCASLLIVAILLPMCGGSETARTDQSRDGVGRIIRMVAHTYMPSDDMEVSEQNPFPRGAIRVLAKHWERQHPGVRIEFVRIPDQTAYVSWVRTQCTGGTVAEIIFWWPPGDELGLKEWVIPLDDYLDRPNRYVSGNERWRDLFLPVCLNPPWKARDGHDYFVPVDVFMTAVFYNKDIFAEAGIERLPETWDEFIDVQERIRQAGYEPFWCPEMRSHWPRSLFGQLLFDKEVFEQLDVLETNGRIEGEEAIRGASLGITGLHEPRFREYLRLMKEWSQYWKGGPSLGGSVESINLFLLGKLAMVWQGAWSLSQMEADPYVEFEFGLFAFPPMTKDTSPVASGRKPLINASPGTCYYVTQSAARNGLADLCADWLMFLTTPENCEELTQETTAIKIPPAVVGTKVAAVLEPIMTYDMSLLEDLIIPWGDGSPEALDNCNRLFELFLMDELDFEETVSRMEKWWEIGIEEAIRINQRLSDEQGRWDMAKW